MVNPSNTWVNEPDGRRAEEDVGAGGAGQGHEWKQVNPRTGPQRPLKLFGAGSDSGTFDYFTEAIVGKAKSSRGDYTASEDDNVLVQGIAGDQNALGYFGYAYYAENKDKLKAVPIVNPKTGKAVAPSQGDRARRQLPAAVAPDLHLRQQEVAASAAEVSEFVNYYLENGADLAKEVKYVPLPDRAYTDGHGAPESRQDRHRLRRRKPTSACRSRSCSSGRLSTEPKPARRSNLHPSVIRRRGACLAPRGGHPFLHLTESSRQPMIGVEPNRPDSRSYVAALRAAVKPPRHLRIRAAHAGRMGHRSAPVHRRGVVGPDHTRHRRRPDVRVVGVLPARLAARVPDRHGVDAAVRQSASYGILPLVAGTLVDDPGRPARGDPRRHDHRDLPERVRAAQGPRDPQAGARTAQRRADRGVRLLRAAVRHAAASEVCPGLPGFNMLSAGLVIGIMIIPYVSSLVEDAMHAVPMYIREGSYAMGATRMQTAFR